MPAKTDFNVAPYSGMILALPMISIVSFLDRASQYKQEN